MANYPAHNPSGKGLQSKRDIPDKDKELVKEIASFNLMLFNMFDGKPQSPEELADRFSKYFDLCIQHNQIPTVEGLALVSNYERKSFYEISKGVFSTQFTPIVQKAKDYIAMFDSQLASKGKIPAPIYIFRSKNFYGMKDNQEVVITPNVAQEIPNNVDEIIEMLPDRDSASE